MKKEMDKIQFVDLKQNTVPYIAVMRFGVWLLIFFAKGAVSNEACISGKAFGCHESLEGDRSKSARGRLYGGQWLRKNFSILLMNFTKQKNRL